MDRISQERILAQLDQENFNSLKYLKEEYFEFKKMNNGYTPYLLVDYLKYDGAPDPLRFITRTSNIYTYQHFVAKVDKAKELTQLLQDELLERILKELSNKLPLKRVYEFVMLRYLLENDSLTLQQAIQEIVKMVKEADEDSIIHAFEVLNQNYYDSQQIKGGIKLVQYSGDRLIKTVEFKSALEFPEYKKYIADIINYAIFRYEKEYGNASYGVPHFKLYEQYKMIDAALLSNYRKTHSAFRGSGLLTNRNDYFLFIDLHKDENIKESINYHDAFLDQGTFQWQTPNSTASHSERGQNIVKNKERGIHLHLFVRKYQKIDGKNEPFIYIGKGNCVHYEGEKPITVKLKLENEIPGNLYSEFTLRV